MNKFIEIALQEYGIKEITGTEHNAEVLKYFKAVKGANIQDDETAWCSAFANWVLAEGGSIGSGKLNARSWLNVGEAVTEPKLGDIAVFWRETPVSWKGHVGFVIRVEGDYVWVLGGNQGNEVKIQAYNTNQLLGYRRIKE
jgi:uncharacterized protein (TIGR02594 family)